jgi:hypothetical protein
MDKKRLEEITYVFLINTDVPMSGGKVGAQVANVAVQLPKVKLKPLEDPCTYILGACEEYMMWLLKNYGEDLGIKYTVDAGFTEYTVGVLTCIGWKLKPNQRVFTNCLPLWKEGLRTSL